MSNNVWTNFSLNLLALGGIPQGPNTHSRMLASALKNVQGSGGEFRRRETLRMDIAVESFVKGFPEFLIQAGLTLGLLITGCVVHVLLTPMKEMKLIREGNVSAGISVAAVIVGLGIPMAACLATATSIYHILIWGAVAILLQLLAFRVADLILNDLPKRIERDEIGAALVLAAVKIAAAMVMAAAL
jgi:putative membrane protein